MTSVLAALLLALAPGSPSQPAPLDQIVAQAVEVALPPDAYDWSMSWGPFGVRLGREVRWHLSDPRYDAAQRDLDPGVFRRVGWLSHDGGTASLAVCGDDREVRSLAMSASDTRLDHDGVVRALADRGVTIIEVSRQDAVPDPEADDHHRSLIRRPAARIAWTLGKPGHRQALMVAEHICTAPGMRSAAQCWTRITLQFGAEDEAPTPCPLPGRWGT